MELDQLNKTQYLFIASIAFNATNIDKLKLFQALTHIFQSLTAVLFG